MFLIAAHSLVVYFIRLLLEIYIILILVLFKFFVPKVRELSEWKFTSRSEKIEEFEP